MNESLEKQALLLEQYSSLNFTIAGG